MSDDRKTPIRIPHAGEYSTGHMSGGELQAWREAAQAVLDTLREVDIDQLDPVLLAEFLDDPGAYTPDDVYMELCQSGSAE